jgi:CheY-like chemotaxis protein
VLIVDDDEFQRMLLARMLQADPYQLVFAASGAEALQAIHQARPDLILMDVQMPGMDGIETTRRLKAMPRFADVAVIMLTGKSEGQVVVDSLNAGAADFVVKPIDRDKLVAKLARWSQPTAAPRG